MAAGKSSLVLSALLVAGVGGGALALMQDRSALIIDSLPKSMSPVFANSIFTKSENRVLFKEMLLFDGQTEGGFPFTTQTYQSWDCMTLRKQVEFLDSPANAKSKLRKAIEEATELLDRGEKFDTAGELVGERAILRVTKDKETPEIRIVWTENSELYLIGSSTLEHALKLEAWLQTSNLRPASFPVSAGKDFVFEPASSTNGITGNGRSFSEQLFRSNDCVTLSARIEHFDSPADAQRELALRVKEAVEIVEKRSDAYTNGSPTDDRTVAIFAPDLPREFSHSAEVLWTENSELHVIRSASLPHVLAFEKLSAR